VELVETADGTLTVYSAAFQDHYHSLSGAAWQARELYLRHGGAGSSPSPKVLELGFGLGVNFFVTLKNALERGVYLRYYALEKDPVPTELLRAVLAPYEGPVLDGLLERWGRSLQMEGEGFCLRVEVAAAEDWQPLEDWAESVYYDLFKPETNSSAWSEEVMRKFFRATAPGGLLVTYSAAGKVRQALERVGYQVSRIPAAGPKRHWTRAQKPR